MTMQGPVCVRYHSDRRVRVFHTISHVDRMPHRMSARKRMPAELRLSHTTVPSLPCGACGYTATAQNGEPKRKTPFDDRIENE